MQCGGIRRSGCREGFILQFAAGAVVNASVGARHHIFHDVPHRAHPLGQAAIELPVALNEAVGGWQVTAADPLATRVVTALIEVE